jgi:hypothetical protein
VDKHRPQLQRLRRLPAITPPPAFDPAQRTFVVDSDVTVVANGQECGLTSGDVITRLTDTPDADQTVSASVSATKKGDCASGQTVAVKVDDLQEMYNHFQENITNGMGELAKKQGTNGMPGAPDTGTQAGAVTPPPPDTTWPKRCKTSSSRPIRRRRRSRETRLAAGSRTDGNKIAVNGINQPRERRKRRSLLQCKGRIFC